MHDMRDELEELAFRWLIREALSVDRGAARQPARQRNKSLIDEIEKELTDEARRGQKSRPRCQGREKRPYSIWRKWSERPSASSSFPIFSAFASIVPTVEDCYRAVGVVHTKWAVVPGRFKDYISTPKQNDYRSIHTTVVGPGSQRVELQIRTQEMDEIAEYGIAAPRALQGQRRRAEDIASARDSSAYAMASPHDRDARGRRRTRKNFWSTPSSSCSRIRCSASRRRAV